MNEMVALLVGAVFGAGIWFMARGAVRRPVPLASARSKRRLRFEAGVPEVPHDVEDADNLRFRMGSSFESTIDGLGIGMGCTRQDLRVASVARSQHAFSKLAAMIAASATPMLAVLALESVGLHVAPVWAVGLALVGVPAGFVFPDLRLRERAKQRRDDFRNALAAYLELVKVLIAGGAHVDGALYQAAQVGEGWPFEELRAVSDWGRVNGHPPWMGFERLADAISVAELSELAGGIALAEEQGASLGEALSRKAESMTAHQMAEARARADSATEQMSVPTVMIAMAFVIFLGYPALSSVAGLT
jgi:tight adherence protein C